MKFNPQIKIILVTFLFCIYSFTNAQTLTVYKFEEDKTDLEAYYNEVKDINGEKCALIKVLINNIDINKILFETKGIEVKKIEKKPPTQIWVYVSPQTQGLVISTAGYGNINYYEFPTGPLKSTKTYKMDLRTDIKLKLVEEKIEPEFLKIKTEPTNDVEVFIDNINQGLTPIKPLKILPGNHSIKLAKNLYHNLDTNVLIKINTNNNFIFKLKPKFGKLVINSKGEFNDAKIYLDEEEKCRTPCTIEVVKSGNHRIIIKKDLYADYDEQFTMYDGQIYTIPNLTLKPIYATISLRTNPKNAEIYINKENVSINGILTNYKVRSGTYFIESNLKNYKDFQKSVVLKEQENFIETIQLEPQLGDISIESDPIDCEIYLNGVKQNRLTPTVLRNLQVGSYQLELKKDGFTSIKKQIEIKDGETTKIFEKLIADNIIPIDMKMSNKNVLINDYNNSNSIANRVIFYGENALGLIKDNKILYFKIIRKPLKKDSILKYKYSLILDINYEFNLPANSGVCSIGAEKLGVIIANNLVVYNFVENKGWCEQAKFELPKKIKILATEEEVIIFIENNNNSLKKIVYDEDFREEKEDEIIIDYFDQKLIGLLPFKNNNILELKQSNKNNKLEFQLVEGTALLIPNENQGVQFHDTYFYIFKTNKIDVYSSDNTDNLHFSFNYSIILPKEFQ